MSIFWLSSSPRFPDDAELDQIRPTILTKRGRLDRQETKLTLSISVLAKFQGRRV